MEKVSVVVSLFNKEKYVKKCITSLIEQTYPNIEIIVINDGSSDRSDDIMKKFFMDKVRYYIWNDNKGVSAARNYGLSLATAQYVTFIDADDYLDKHYIEDLMKYKKYDIVISGYTSKIFESYTAKKLEYIELNDKEIMDFTMKKNNFPFFSQPWGKLYKKSIIDKRKLYFPSISFGEDTAFVLTYLNGCKDAIIIENTGYINVENDGTLSRKYISDISNQLQILTDIVNSENILNNTFKISFWYMRNIKLKLINSHYRFKIFIDECKKTESELRHISVKKLESTGDRILYYLLKYKLYLLIYILLKLKQR